MPLVLHDTLARAERPFEPREPGKVGMYVCGPTVQAEAHIGHGRSQVVFDTLRRFLVWSGYEVRMVVNITDVDDKIILRANREGVPFSIVAERNARAWNTAMQRLRILDPDIQPLATGHIPEIIAMIQQMIDKGVAYVVEGSVLFRVRDFEGYGKLSNRKLDEMQQGDDGVVDKEDVVDFAMWKAAKPGEPSWDSPWGPGRPGWHIECSAMAGKHLGSGFDIHGGGFDLVFPHHENEITQYEAATGEPFASYWVHNGMLRLGEEKMSKSLGNIVGLAEAIDDYGAGPLRLWYLSAHHRSPLTYEDELVRDAQLTHQRWATFLRTLPLVVPAGTSPAEGAAEAHVAAFREAMEADLNAPRAVAALHELVTAGNEALTKADKGDEAAAGEAVALAEALVTLADDVLGLGLADAVQASVDAGARIAPLVESALEQRAQARADKDWARADALRDQLAESGVVVEDRPAGSRWYVEIGAS